MGKMFLEIIYEEMFKPTEETPVEVVISDEKFEELARKYGMYGLTWYFVDASTIKYFDEKELTWKYEKVVPEKVIRAKEKLREVI
jgi:hypothetical protein